MANFSGQSVKTQRRPNWVWFSRLCHWCVSTRQTTSVCQVQSRAVRWWTQKEENFYNKKKKKYNLSLLLPPPPPHQCHFPLIWVFLQIFPEGNKRKEMSRRRVTQIEFDGRIDPVGRVHRSPDTGLFGCRSRSRDRLSTNQRPPSKPTRLFFRTWWNKIEFQLLGWSNSCTRMQMRDLSVKCLRPTIGQPALLIGTWGCCDKNAAVSSISSQLEPTDRQMTFD